MKDQYLLIQRRLYVISLMIMIFMIILTSCSVSGIWCLDVLRRYTRKKFKSYTTSIEMFFSGTSMIQ